MSTYTHRPPELSRLGHARYHLGQVAKQCRLIYWHLRIASCFLLETRRKRPTPATGHEVTAAASQLLLGRNVSSDLNSSENAEVMAAPLAGAADETEVML